MKIKRIVLWMFVPLIGWGGLSSPALAAGRGYEVTSALNDYEYRHTEAVRDVSNDGSTGSPDRMDCSSGGCYALAPSKKVISFHFGLETYSYLYRETMTDGSEFMNNKGWFKGVFASMVYRPLTMDPYWGQFMDHFILEGRVAWGDINYSGGVQGVDNGQPVIVPLDMGSIPDVVTEWRALIAKDWDIYKTTLTPYFGAGFRYLRDDPSGVTGTFTYQGVEYSINGYERESTYVYLPIGVNITRNIPVGWQLGFNGEFDLFLYGDQISRIDSDLGSAPRNHQTSGYGARAGLRLTKEFPTVGVSLEPFIRYWNIAQSEFAPTELCSAGQPCNGVYEPKNTTSEVGAKVGLTF